MSERVLPLASASARLKRHPGRPRKEERAGVWRTFAPAEGAGESQTSTAAVPVLCPISPRLLDLPTAAAYLGVSSWTVRDLEAAGLLPRVRVPLPNGGELRKLLFDREDLDQLIRSWKDAAP